MLPSSHRQGRACTSDRTPGVLRANVRCPRCLCDRARREQSRENNSFLAADEAIQTTRMPELHITCRSFQHSVTLRTSLIEISIFITSGCAEETDNEQGFEHSAVTNVATAEQVPDRVECQISASGVQLQFNSSLYYVFYGVFVSRTHQMHFCARIHKLNFFDEPEQIQKIHLETRHFSRSLPELPRSPSSHCCSRGKKTRWCRFR